MKYIAVFDIGTTSIKGVLLDKHADLKGPYSVLLETYTGPDGNVEQDPLDWWKGVKEMAWKWWNELDIDPHHISMITFAGQMEDVIPIADDVSRAILYSDTRASEEAEWINQKFPTIHEILGNTVSASTPVAKLRWLEKHNLSLYQNTPHFVFSAKDFIIYKMTNSVVTDPTTGATTGMMNLKKRQWEKRIIESIGIEETKLPKLLNAENIAGYLSKDAASETGFCENTPVLCGCGDAGASSVGASAVDQGDSYFYIGTTGWAAIIREGVKEDSEINGLFHLAHLPNDSTISIAPLLNVGNVHRWAVRTFTGSENTDRYDAFENLLKTSKAGSNGLLFLPYLHGERCPVRDSDARGAFWGIGPNTEDSDFARAVIEGISFALKQLIDLLNDNTSGNITLIGGGSKSESWCQILADCIGKPIRVPFESEYMPALGASSSAFIKLGWAKDYSDFSRHFIMSADASVYRPNMDNFVKYKEIYNRYLKMYPALKGIYS
ncbi:xylulokinase [Virgibacillus subterraneus]|uniref:Xylulokinase n=1 Tax=Virgibacillus subterraneus TaxID=621109 RepID=A0A1H9ARQ0_9BACI|nr:FGGY family carbohydrate kinase [Virgibacillus subterraneus]SEP79073.1 xylulokinase [Virgibacillus subterraneus]